MLQKYFNLFLFQISLTVFEVETFFGKFVYFLMLRIIYIFTYISLYMNFEYLSSGFVHRTYGTKFISKDHSLWHRLD